MTYFETNYTDLFSRVQPTFNESGEIAMNIVNGNGTLQLGHISTVSKIEGFDLLMQLEIVQTILLVVITVLLSIYVTMYVMRFATGD